jgi:hypothetical protein
VHSLRLRVVRAVNKRSKSKIPAQLEMIDLKLLMTLT